ncbi:MAG: hypothetical protein BMS9Abin36_0432 [Gammaproteobacteria bacterium]|nr:MAG: hypothetical protein BMS9Abin36_0432 [Gammaproteobacteria bacterium]
MAHSPIKYIFFDIDGTLLNRQGQVSQAVANELHRIQGLGIGTAIASGRPYFACRHLIKQFSLGGPGVFYSSALVYDSNRDQELYSEVLASNDVQNIIQQAERNNIYYELYTRDNYFIQQEHPYASVQEHYLKQRAQPCLIKELIRTHKIYKVVLTINEKSQKEDLRELKIALPQFTFADAQGAEHKEILFSNITGPRATKSRAFESVLDYLRLTPEQVMAIGDSDSDKDFITMAGTGVAMGDSPDEVKAVANHITLSTDDDGVACALHELIR